MSHIVLTEEQAQVIAEASGLVEVRDPQGQPFAYLTVLSPGGSESTARNGGASSPDAEPFVPPSAETPLREETEPYLEFCWSTSRSKVRNAVKEFTEQTHADY